MLSGRIPFLFRALCIPALIIASFRRCRFGTCLGCSASSSSTSVAHSSLALARARGLWGFIDERRFGGLMTRVYCVLSKTEFDRPLRGFSPRTHRRSVDFVGLQLLVPLLIVIACAIAARDLGWGPSALLLPSQSITDGHPRQGRKGPSEPDRADPCAGGWLQRRPIHLGSRPAKMHVPGCIDSVTALSFFKTGAAPCGNPPSPMQTPPSMPVLAAGERTGYRQKPERGRRAHHVGLWFGQDGRRHTEVTSSNQTGNGRQPRHAPTARSCLGPSSCLETPNPDGKPHRGALRTAFWTRPARSGLVSSKGSTASRRRTGR
jgi:hypothetical protein